MLRECLITTDNLKKVKAILKNANKEKAFTKTIFKLQKQDNHLNYYIISTVYDDRYCHIATESEVARQLETLIVKI